MKLFAKLDKTISTPRELPGLMDVTRVQLAGMDTKLDLSSLGNGRSQLTAKLTLGRMPFSAEAPDLRKDLIARAGSRDNGRNGPRLDINPDQTLSATVTHTIATPATSVERSVAVTHALLSLLPTAREFAGVLKP